MKPNNMLFIPHIRIDLQANAGTPFKIVYTICSISVKA